MGNFEARYTEEQRDVVARAFEDRKIRPARRIGELAAAGELEGLAPFTIPDNTIRDLARKLRQGRKGLTSSKVGDMQHRDGIEVLRRRLMNVADYIVTDIERDYAARKKRPNRLQMLEEFRQAIRCVREAAALPGPQDPRPAAPGANKDGERNGGATQGGLAGVLLQAHRARGLTPAQGAQHTQRTAEKATNRREATEPTHEPTHTQTEANSGSRESEASLGGDKAVSSRMHLKP